jgi:outer membrane protein OmpA-like peptidoglycan-associated protein
MFQNDYYFGGRASARLISFVWLDVAGGITSAKPCNCNQTWAHYSGNLMLMGVNPRRISPFMSLGAGISQYRPPITADRKDGVVEAAGGVRVRISDGMGIRVEARNLLLVPKEMKSAHIDNTVLGLGLVYAFGGRPPDSDGDGVPDKRDKCPDTPHGCTVDVNGCPIDSDGDGVCDGIDQRPNTPRGAKVDAKGIPIDSDGDGVFDGLDACPDTPAGCPVDAKGCPSDADGDGVCDGLDQCPGTTKGCTVDAKGCPIDSDGDGVCDGLDKCANTPAGTKVDSVGCPVVVIGERETELLDTGRIRISNINFDTGKATVRPDAYAVLDTVGKVLTKWPGLKVEIGGHTDSRGSDKYNQALSQRRAAAVRAYLLAHFKEFKPEQITAKGYGESRPRVPNTSPPAMQLNRRVEFVVLNTEILKREK